MSRMEKKDLNVLYGKHHTPEYYEFASQVIKKKTKSHPCYNGCDHAHARIHLPVAKKCNIQCNYCLRKYDCANESRPGVTTKLMTPQEAFLKYVETKEKMPNLSVVGIAGPGDALADFDKTRETLKLIREYDKDITFCLSTNGLMLPVYAQELIDLGVSHVTVTINAIDPSVSSKIYDFVNYEGQTFIGQFAGEILLRNQIAGLVYLVSKGIVCKVNIVTLKGINDKHIPDVVAKMKEIGCFITNIMPFIPVKGSVFESLPSASKEEVDSIRNKCGDIMMQMYHCKQCRADAVGTL